MEERGLAEPKILCLYISIWLLPGNAATTQTLSPLLSDIKIDKITRPKNSPFSYRSGNNVHFGKLIKTTGPIFYLLQNWPRLNILTYKILICKVFILLFVLSRNSTGTTGTDANILLLKPEED